MTIHYGSAYYGFIPLSHGIIVMVQNSGKSRVHVRSPLLPTLSRAYEGFTKGVTFWQKSSIICLIFLEEEMI